ncbi:MAG: hypothetical protein RLZZ241_1193 [Bacteroidota bacterium]|jgi:hypothetical protein
MLQSKFWQGFFAIGPLAGILLLLVGYLIFLFSMVIHADQIQENGNLSFSFISGLGFILGIVFLWGLVSVGSLIFYIVHAAKNPNLSANNYLLVWILLFIFTNGIGQLIYWIVEILNKKNIDLIPGS